MTTRYFVAPYGNGCLHTDPSCSYLRHLKARELQMFNDPQGDILERMKNFGERNHPKKLSDWPVMGVASGGMPVRIACVRCCG